jgi:hypothetical protein
MPAETRDRLTSKQIRRLFFVELAQQVQVIWPILSGILLIMAGCGVVVGRIESWGIGESLYFTFVTGLTIGYGDVTPTHFMGRLLSIVIALAGVVLIGLVAAISVQALETANLVQGATDHDRPE